MNFVVFIVTVASATTAADSVGIVVTDVSVKDVPLV